MKIEMDVLKRDFQLGKCIMYGESVGMHDTANCCTGAASFISWLSPQKTGGESLATFARKAVNFQHVIM